MQISSISRLPANRPAPGKKPKEEHLWRQIYKNRVCYLFIAPMAILFFTFTIYPFFASLGYTLYQWNGIGDPSAFVGLDNFVQVIHDPLFWNAFAHTFIYMGVLVPVQLTLALTLALVLNNPKLRFSTFYRSVYFLPVVTSPAVVGIVIQLLLSNFGSDLNKLLINLHLTNSYISWLGDPRTAMAVIIIVGIWNTLGYNLVYFLAGLQTIPRELYEASRLDGANNISQFFSVTIPMLRGTGLVILILAILGSLQVFDLIKVLTDGGPFFATDVVNTYIYRQAFGDFSVAATQPNVGFASAASFFYGLLILAIALIQIPVFRRVRR